MPDAAGEPYLAQVIDDGLVVRVNGDVNLKTSPEFRTFLLGQISKSPTRLAVDLSGVSFMDSSGVATLVEALRMQRQKGNALVLCALQQRVLSVFKISKLDTLFTIIEQPPQPAQA